MSHIYKDSTSPPPSATPVDTNKASKIKEILKSNGIQNEVSAVLTKDNGLRGENLASVTEYLEVHFKDDKPVLNLFMKKQHEISDKATQDMMVEYNYFDKETQFYCDYLGEARKFCKSIGHEDLLKMYPKCYYGDNRMIIFENLVLDQGYVLLDKLERQDFGAASMALTNLAKHHALGHALINKLGGPEEFFKRYPLLNWESMLRDSSKQFLEPSFETGIKTNLNILKKNNSKDADEAYKTLQSEQGKSFGDIRAAMETYPDTFLVLNHGDYWNNNMMWIKDKGTGKLLNHILVDFQVVRYNSPALDLSYYLFSSVKQEVRHQRLRELLQIYLKALRDTASDLGYPVSLTMDQLEREFCRHFKFGFWMGTTMLSEAGMAVFKDIQEALKEVDAMSDMGAKIGQLMEQWVERHPEQSTRLAKVIIGQMQEWDLLISGRIY